ncbi:MAG TPA: EAL domain-containing protein, partial [Sulfurimonas sp.]|nr:EAL domain-containing protein [Sulfurimonas sp.]
MAMQSDLIYEIYSWAIKTAIKQIKHWQDKYKKKLSLSISIPDKQLSLSTFNTSLFSFLKKSSCEPKFSIMI